MGAAVLNDLSSNASTQETHRRLLRIWRKKKKRSSIRNDFGAVFFQCKKIAPPLDPLDLRSPNAMKDGRFPPSQGEAQ